METKLQKAIGKKLKHIRKNVLKLKHHEFAQLINRTIGTISNYENGLTRPDIEVLERIFENTTITPDSFFDYIQKNPVVTENNSVFEDSKNTV
jgi:transcriptional regulator with XRE-family HTH domain